MSQGAVLGSKKPSVEVITGFRANTIGNLVSHTGTTAIKPKRKVNTIFSVNK